VPIGYMLVTSVFDVGLTTFQHSWRFAGLANYLDLLYRDPQLWPTLWRTSNTWFSDSACRSDWGWASPCC